LNASLSAYEIGWAGHPTVLAERGGWKGDNGVFHKPSGRGIRSLLQRYPVPKHPREKAQRYEHENPGDLGHIDIKKLPSIKGENAKINGIRLRS